MKNLIKLTLTLAIAFTCNYTFGQAADTDKKPAIVFVEDGDGNVFNGKIYASSARGASRGGNGNSNGAFGNPGDWSVDLVVSEKSPADAAGSFGGFIETSDPTAAGAHPLYTVHPCFVYFPLSLKNYLL